MTFANLEAALPGLLVATAVVLALLAAVFIFRVIRSLARAADDARRARVRAKAQEQAIRLAEKQEQASRRAHEVLQAEIALNELRQRERAQMIKLGTAALPPGDTKQLFQALDSRFGIARASFVHSLGTLRKFRSYLVTQSGNQPAIQAAEMLLGLVDRLPQETEYLPSAYIQGAQVEPWDRFFPGRLPTTDKLLASLYEMARLFQAAPGLVRVMPPENQEAFYDKAISVALLMNDALCYQLAHFQSEVILEHVARGRQLVAVDLGVASIDNLIDRYVRAERDPLAKVPASARVIEVQQANILKRIQRQAHTIRDHLIAGSGDVDRLIADVGDRFDELLNNKRELARAYRASQVPTERLANLLALGKTMEVVLLPTLAASFGYQLDHSNS